MSSQMAPRNAPFAPLYGTAAVTTSSPFVESLYASVNVRPLAPFACLYQPRSCGFTLPVLSFFPEKNAPVSFALTMPTISSSPVTMRSTACCSGTVLAPSIVAMSRAAPTAYEDFSRSQPSTPAASFFMFSLSSLSTLVSRFVYAV